MTDGHDDNPWAPPGSDDAAPAPWSSSSSSPSPSSLPPPPRHGSVPPPPPPAPLTTDLPELPAAVVAPVDAAPPSALGRWIGRGAAVCGAVAIVGGAGYLALNAGSAASGAASPEAAMTELLDALSAEDLLGAAELIEPTERETLVDAGFALADELARLEVLADDLDLSAIRGIDYQFRDVELRSERVGDSVVNVIIEDGWFEASYDASELPLGPLVLDRVDPDWLDSADTVDDPLVTSDSPPITFVERDGRWYLSLWYTVAENARRAIDARVPDADEHLTAVGAESPEAAVRALVAEAEDLDLRGVMTLLDPDEARVLYEYAPLFLGDVESARDDFLAEMEVEGATWEVHTLELRTDQRGADATVVVEAIGFSLRAEDITFDLEASEERVVYDAEIVEWDGSPSTVHVETEGDCTVIEYENEWDGIQRDELCADELLGQFGLSTSLFAGASTGWGASTGIETHRVEGRWYVSPTRSVTAPMLDVLRGWSPDEVAEAVDAFIGFVEDPLGLGDDGVFVEIEPFGDDQFADDQFGDDQFADPFEPASTTTTIPPLIVPTTTFDPAAPNGAGPAAANIDLVEPGFDWSWSYDLDVDSIGFEYELWLPGSTAPTAERAVYVEGQSGAGIVTMVVVELATPEAAVAHFDELRARNGAVLRPLVGVEVLESADGVGDPVLVAVRGRDIIVVGTYGADLVAMDAVLAAQLSTAG